MSIILTAKELEEITGRKIASAQIRWLRQNGFTALQRADGMPLISRAHFEAKMGGFLGQSKQKDYEPDLGALNAS